MYADFGSWPSHLPRLHTMFSLYVKSIVTWKTRNWSFSSWRSWELTGTRRGLALMIHLALMLSYLLKFPVWNLAATRRFGTMVISSVPHTPTAMMTPESMTHRYASSVHHRFLKLENCQWNWGDLPVWKHKINHRISLCQKSASYHHAPSFQWKDQELRKEMPNQWMLDRPSASKPVTIAHPVAVSHEVSSAAPVWPVVQTLKGSVDSLMMDKVILLSGGRRGY